MKHANLLLVCCLLLVALTGQSAQSTLQYDITGLPSEARENAYAYLGPPPDSIDERDNFLFSARQQVEQSLNALGYYEPIIEFELDRAAAVWHLNIHVDPGAQVQFSRVDVKIEGEAREDEAFADLLSEIPLVAGEPLHHGHYEEFKASLQSLGYDRGYFEGALSRSRVSVDLDAAEAVVELHYDSGNRFRIGEITFDEYPLSDQRLQQLLTFEQGDPFDVGALKALQADLQRTGYFGTAQVKPETLNLDSDEVPVHVELSEGDRNHYRVGLGYSTDTRERASITWRTPMINQKGHSQETRLEYSPVRPRATINYSVPLGHPLNDKLVFGARRENNEYGSIDSQQGELSVRRAQILRDWIVSTGVRLLDEDWEVGPSDRGSDYLLPGISASHSTRKDELLDPAFGFSQYYGFELGVDQAGSAMDLQRIYANFRGVYTVAPRHRLVGRAELGAVFFAEGDRPDLAPSLSFFAGGTESIRGYAYQSLGPVEEATRPDGETVSLVVGGDRLAIVSGEYQYYVTPEWRAALFVDAGNAFNAGDFDPVVGAGLGVHYVSPVGAVRIDFGNSVSENSSTWRVHLTVGAEF